ncbi:hypothetical protein ACQ4LE_009354 [Meloidogyne hapla]|uniref:6-pyruvoyltetrahydropterin synthase n=1 Tax=Meloidogyne hapla TaxID=6305 RepID=A0A1I8BME1_MELHA
MNIQSTSNPEIVEVKVFANGTVEEEVDNEDTQFSQIVDELLEKNTVVRFNFTASSKGKELLRRDGYEFRFEADSKIEDGMEIWRCVHQHPYCKGRIHVKRDLIVHDGQKFKLGTVANGQHNHPAKHEAVRDALNILKEQACLANPPPVRDAVKLARESVPVDLRKAGECSTSTMGRCYRNYLKKFKNQPMDIKIELDSPTELALCKASWWYWFTKLDENFAGCKNCDWVKSRGNAKSTSILRSHLKSRHPELFAQKLEADKYSSKWRKPPKRKAPQDSNSFEIAMKSESLDQGNNSFVAIESPARSQASLSDIQEYNSTSDTNEERPIDQSNTKQETTQSNNEKITDMLRTLFNPNIYPFDDITVMSATGINNNTNNSTGLLTNNQLNENQQVVKLSRIEHFSAAHRLNNPKLSVQENNQLFGKCNNPNGHGHNYKLKVVLEGPVNAETGMVYNLSDLKREMSQVLELVDHRNLDKDVAYFRDNSIVSTTENLAIFLFDELRARMSSPELLKKVVVDETDKNSFTYSG